MLLKNECLSVDILGHWISRLQFNGKHFIFPRQEIIYRNRMRAVKMRGGSHPCFPVFGTAPPDYPNIPQHGWLRNEDAILKRLNPSTIISYSEIGGVARDYPWKIGCETMFIISGNTLTIQHAFTRVDGQQKKAPFNLGLHHYWINPNGIKTDLGFWDSHDAFRGTLEPSRMTPWNEANDPVELEILGIGKVKMSMESEGDHQIIVWSDHEYFLCVEQVIDDPTKFGTQSSLHLNSDFTAKFILEFE